ncbi:MAG: right-handed parallel beta-helix repeat-containing protein [Victivallales bacterium]|jgi:hypothetical protein|nr:right-handed parallel beta-helix repeat-containing protein [Victivallales bacterium]MBT7303551.1 right-handed parallel beta-helix repeat-containing protein [Victivallales bacterium]
MRTACALLCILSLLAAAQEPVVLSPVAGDNAPALRIALDTLRKQKGGVLVLSPGTYLIGAQLSLDNLTDAHILGRGEVILQLLPERHTRTTKAAKKGDSEILVQRADVFAPGLAIELQGAIRDTLTPEGKPHRISHLSTTIKEVQGDRLILARPLTADVPAGAPVVHPMNLFDGRRNIRNLTIQNLTLDLNRDAWPVRPFNHARNSGIFLHGPYSYETGPTGPPLEGVRIIDCTIKNSHHRGIAFYNVRNSGVYHCRIENTAAEGIDFDHFVTHCQAVGNVLVNCRNIELNDASDCLVSDNLLRTCRTGIVVWQWCQLPGLNERNLILRNRFEDCPPPAISLRKGADHSTIRNNSGRFAKGPAIVVDGKGNLIGDNPFQIEQGDVQRIAPGNLQAQPAGE